MLSSPEAIAGHNWLVGFNEALDWIGRLPLIESEKIEADLLEIAKNTPELMESGDDETPRSTDAP